MKKSQRIERKQAHAEAYKEGWDDCERFYAGVLAKLLAEEGREVDKCTCDICTSHEVGSEEWVKLSIERANGEQSK